MVEDIKLRALAETSFIKSEINRTGNRMRQMEHTHNYPLDYLRREVYGLKKGVLNTSSHHKWSEDMDSDITPILYLI